MTWRSGKGVMGQPFRFSLLEAFTPQVNPSTHLIHKGHLLGPLPQSPLNDLDLLGNGRQNLQDGRERQF